MAEERKGAPDPPPGLRLPVCPAPLSLVGSHEDHTPQDGPSVRDQASCHNPQTLPVPIFMVVLALFNNTLATLGSAPAPPIYCLAPGSGCGGPSAHSTPSSPGRSPGQFRSLQGSLGSRVPCPSHDNTHPLTGAVPLGGRSPPGCGLMRKECHTGLLRVG